MKPRHFAVLPSALASLQGSLARSAAVPTSASSPPPADSIGRHGEGQASQLPIQQWLQPLLELEKSVP